MLKTPTLKDVAGRLGMHKSTVSLALSGKGTISAETRRRVINVAKELGYEPNPIAQRLASGDTAAMVGIFTGTLDVGLATEKILLIQKALAQKSLEAPIYTCYDPLGDEEQGETQAAQVRQLCRQRPRALICAAQRVPPAVFAELSAYQSQGGILVSYDTPTPLSCDQVIFDREDNAYRAARHLLERGHRRIGIGMSQIVGGARDPQEHRLKGFCRALSEYGVSFRSEWLFQNATYESGGAEMASRYLSLSDRPSGLTIVNDYVALAFMVEVMRAGVRIPEELSVVGHDDQVIASYCPVPLTSMTQPTHKIADEVVRMTVERVTGTIDATTPPRTIEIVGRLVERDSVSAPPIDR